LCVTSSSDSISSRVSMTHLLGLKGWWPALKQAFCDAVRARCDVAASGRSRAAMAASLLQLVPTVNFYVPRTQQGFVVQPSVPIQSRIRIFRPGEITLTYLTHSCGPDQTARHRSSAIRSSFGFGLGFRKRVCLKAAPLSLSSGDSRADFTLERVGIMGACTPGFTEFRNPVGAQRVGRVGEVPHGVNDLRRPPERSKDG